MVMIRIWQTSVPIDDFQEHRLVKALHKMEQGGYDFDIYCMLWANAKTEWSQSASRSSKTKLIFPTYDASAEFDVLIMPKTVQDVYRELCLSMSKVEIERARAKKEADQLAAIAVKVAAAKKAAEEQLEKDKQEAEVEAKALSLADQVMDIVVLPAGRMTRQSLAKETTEVPSDEAKEAAQKVAQEKHKEVLIFLFSTFFHLFVFYSSPRLPALTVLVRVGSDQARCDPLQPRGC